MLDTVNRHCVLSIFTLCINFWFHGKNSETVLQNCINSNISDKFGMRSLFRAHFSPFISHTTLSAGCWYTHPTKKQICSKSWCIVNILYGDVTQCIDFPWDSRRFLFRLPFFLFLVFVAAVAFAARYLHTIFLSENRQILEVRMLIFFSSTDANFADIFPFLYVLLLLLCFFFVSCDARYSQLSSVIVKKHKFCAVSAIGFSMQHF